MKKSGYLSYGMDMGGCEFTAIDCDFVNNAVNGIGNDDVNPSNMTFDNCRFAFGKNNGKLSFPQFFENASVTEDSNIVNIKPIPSVFSSQSNSAHATTSIGNYEIIITDDVRTLCQQQIISIVKRDGANVTNVTFESPNASAKYTKFTEIVGVIGHEGGPGSIIVRDAPHDKVTKVEISFVAPRLVLYDKIAPTPVAEMNWE